MFPDATPREQHTLYWQQIKEMQKLIINSVRLFGLNLVNAAPCVNSYELIAFDFQVEQLARNRFRHFLVDIESTPQMHLDSAGAWSLFPKIVDDMYDLTLD